MKVHNVEQGSPEWLQLRAGIPTASCFDQILTPTGLESKQVEALENKLVAERLMGHPADSMEANEHMKRGNELEPEAADFYASLMTTGEKIQVVGFVTNDEGTIGCSPDRLIGDDGMLEIKCPAAHTHVKYLLGKAIDQAYMPQLQGQLWIAERKWVDIISYHPEMKPVIIRVRRDEGYISQLNRCVNRVVNNVNVKYKQIQQEA